MKTKFSLARMAALCLLALSGPLQATTTNTITVMANPKTGGEVGGGGKYVNGSTAIITATNNDCYVFTDWTVAGKKIVNNPYSFTVTGNESLTANFAQIKYPISTSTSPGNAGTISGGGDIGCGDTATLTAKAKAGFAFTGWTSTDETPSTNSKISFTVTNSESFVAYFKDIQAPTVSITAPTPNESVATSAFVIQGKAHDNVAVAGVYYNYNGGGWALASTSNGFATWYAIVSLPPNTINNTVSAYAVDTSGNMSAVTKAFTFKCSAAGYAPMSIAEQMATVTSGNSSFQVSFDSAGYVRISSDLSNGGEVGTYTYTPTGPDTAEFVPQQFLPKQGNGTTPALELTFTNAFNATYTEDGTNGGAFQFSAAAASVPASLDGAVVIQTSTASPNFISTNIFDSGTFAESNSLAGSSSGSYTFTQFTPVAALLAETSAGPTTNYTFLWFTEGATPPAGNYFSGTLAGSNLVNPDYGAFSASVSAVTTEFAGPATLAGLQATFTPTVEPAKGFTFFTRTFGRGTFASMYLPPASDLDLFSDGPNDVGIYIANTRLTANSGMVSVMALAPPYAVGVDETTDELSWKSPTSGTSSNEVTGETSALALSKPLAQNAPASLSGQVITATLVGSSKSGSLTFKYNTFVGGGGEAGVSGTYTYAPYTPTMALVQLTKTTSEVDYVVLNFESTGGGTCVVSQPSGAGWELRPGTFRIAK